MCLLTGATAESTSEILDASYEFLGIVALANKYQHLKVLAQSVLVLVAIADSGVLFSSSVKTQKIPVMGDKHSPLSVAVCQLCGIISFDQSSVTRRGDIDSKAA